MLINLSNHPSETWSSAQLEAATQEFGLVQDIPFPTIPPDMSSSEVVMLAEQYAKKVISILPSEVQPPDAVHIMGELTFGYAIVAILQKQTIRCIASTTERNVEVLADNTRTVRFEFKRFREYFISSNYVTIL